MLTDGTNVPTDDVFAMFVAARDGDIATVRRLAARTPSIATVEYNYTPPIHFAVREGHRDIAEFLLNHGADPAYRSYPFGESLLTFAEDRGHADVADLLRERLSQRFAVAPGTKAIIDAATRGDLAAVEGSWCASRPLLARVMKRATRRFIRRRAEGTCRSFTHSSLRARRWTRCVAMAIGRYTVP
jgi:hypothetical protein